MNCKELVDFLLDYLAGELPDGVRQHFELHLAACPPCVAYLKTYERTVQLGRAAFADPPEAVDAEIPEVLVQAILATCQASRSNAAVLNGPGA